MNDEIVISDSPANQLIDMPHYDVVDIEKQVEVLEKRIELSNRIKQVVFKCTSRSDWADMNGKPYYLQCHGAEKIAAHFGVGWKNVAYTKDIKENGHYIYTCKMTMIFNSREIEVIGTRASDCAFFGYKNKKLRDVESIDETNIKKSAYTNCLGSGIKRMLGIRDLTWEEIKDNVREEGVVNKVTYNKQPNNAPRQSAPAVTENMNIISKKQLNYARSLYKEIGFTIEQLNDFLEKNSFSVTADKVAEMPRAEAKVFLELLIKLKDGEVI